MSGETSGSSEVQYSNILTKTGQEQAGAMSRVRKGDGDGCAHKLRYVVAHNTRLGVRRSGCIHLRPYICPAHNVYRCTTAKPWARSWSLTSQERLPTTLLHNGRPTWTRRFSSQTEIRFLLSCWPIRYASNLSSQ